MHTYNVIASFREGDQWWGDVDIEPGLSEKQFLAPLFEVVLRDCGEVAVGDLIKFSVCLMRPDGAVLPEFLAENGGKFFFNTERNPSESVARWDDWRREWCAHKGFDIPPRLPPLQQYSVRCSVHFSNSSEVRKLTIRLTEGVDDEYRFVFYLFRSLMKAEQPHVTFVEIEPGRVSGGKDVTVKAELPPYLRRMVVFQEGSAEAAGGDNPPDVIAMWKEWASRHISNPTCGTVPIL